jgi:hypothetical protein
MQRLNLAGGERLACDSLMLDTGARPPRFARLAVIGVGVMGPEGPAEVSGETVAATTAAPRLTQFGIN